MSLLALLAVMFGLKRTAQSGPGPVAAAAVLVGLVAGVAFARRQLRLADPMIDLRLFRIREFNGSLATNLLGVFIVVGYFLFVAQTLRRPPSNSSAAGCRACGCAQCLTWGSGLAAL
jgi:MFS transporter, DHA2 family, multidrug resistance protein